ncbi:MAG: RNA degradosome polyphosphate kinase, partial [Candidatus Methylomirabilales bacterium]
MPRLKKGLGEGRNRDGAAEATLPSKKRAPHLPVPQDASQYLNRELSLLAFFRRVLEEAQDERNPLLERVKFLSIVGSNLAEFFMVRVAGLKQQVEAGVIELSNDGLTPSEQLLAVRQGALELMQDARRCLHQLLPLLDEAGLHILDYHALTDQQRTAANEYFEQVVFPVLTPLAFDPGRPFPHISNMSLNLAVVIRDPLGQERFARVKVPNTLPRLLPINAPGDAADGTSGVPPVTLVWLEQVIAANLHRLFPGMAVIEAQAFRVTRDAEMAIQELEAEDLLETIERSVWERRFGSVVRVTMDPGMPANIRDLLTENLEIGPNDIYTIDPPLGSSDLMGLHALDRHTLKDAPFLPAIPPVLGEESDIFAAIRRQDILLHHPYDSFAPVVEFLRAAARDPNVLAIKQTLYR